MWVGDRGPAAEAPPEWNADCTFANRFFQSTVFTANKPKFFSSGVADLLCRWGGGGCGGIPVSPSGSGPPGWGEVGPGGVGCGSGGDNDTSQHRGLPREGPRQPRGLPLSPRLEGAEPDRTRTLPSCSACWEADLVVCPESGTGPGTGTAGRRRGPSSPRAVRGGVWGGSEHPPRSPPSLFSAGSPPTPAP